VSTNVSRHFQHVRTLADSSEVKLHTFMPLKKTQGSKGGPSSLLVVLDGASKLSIHSLEGEVLLEAFDLGHGEGRTITDMSLSPSQDNHFVVTADDMGSIRVHNLKVVSKNQKADEGTGGGSKTKRQLLLTSNFSCAFELPTAATGEARKLTAVLPIDRGSQTYFVTGDSLGGIAVFFRNGTMKGRVRVTEDPGGVRGLLRSQGHMVLFYSSHSFGFFSATQIDVQYPPCSGWNSPLFDVVLDPSSSSSRVVLALSDGDVLIFSTARGKSKACDLTLKFPHVSALPFKLHAFRGHIMALPTPLEETQRKADYLREIYFFNLAAMEAGYGVAPSRTVALQASFKPKQPETLALFVPSGGAAAGGDRGGKSQIAIRFADSPGVELYDLSLKQPSTPKAASSGGGGGGGSTGGGGSDEGWGSWLNWFPKIGVFGIALVGVVIWNVRKVTGQPRNERIDDFDDDFIKERLRERRERKQKEQSESAADLGGSRVEEIGGGDD